MSIAALKIALSLGVVYLLASVAAAGTSTTPIFGYEGSIGPDHWASLNSNFSKCKSGLEQSPINIVEDEVIFTSSLQYLKRDYCDANATLFNNGFNIELRFEEGIGNLLIDGKNYSLQKLHWHSPSEHTINSQRFAFEEHLVHKSQDGDLAVIAILYQFGRSDPFLNQFMAGLKELAKVVNSENEAANIAVGIVDNKFLISAAPRYYRYIGSLSVPPCTENVSWTVISEVREMSPKQAKILRSPLSRLYRNNARPLQPLNGRVVELFDASKQNNNIWGR